MTIPDPGLKLDKLIAEKVLGWCHDSNVGGPRAWWFSPDRPENPRTLPYFSEEIEAAWQLAERFKFIVMPFDENKWVAFKTFKMGPTRGVVANRVSVQASHAICLAALAEVENED